MNKETEGWKGLGKVPRSYRTRMQTAASGSKACTLSDHVSHITTEGICPSPCLWLPQGSLLLFLCPH